METIPNRTNDAGPDRAESPATWRDHLADARETVADAIRLYRDDSQVERKLRMEAIEGAIESLRLAKKALPNGTRVIR